MVIIKAKIVDSRHLELYEDIQYNTGEIYVTIMEKNTIDTIRGAWGIDIDSAEFVEKLRKSKPIEPV
jgi:hypothetical protein